MGGFYVTTIPIWIAWLKYLSFVYYGYDLLLKIEYSGRTVWDCNGITPPNPWSDPRCTIVPPGGLADKLHLQVLLYLDRKISKCHLMVLLLIDFI